MGVGRLKTVLKAIVKWSRTHRVWGMALGSLVQTGTAFLRFGGDSGQVPGPSMGKQRPLVARTHHASEPQRPFCFNICQILSSIFKYCGIIIYTDVGRKDLGSHLGSFV